jgi:hypothetical protein
LDKTTLPQIEILLRNNDQDDLALEKIRHLAFPILLQWESQSAIFRSGLKRLRWWETFFAQKYPLTYERLKRSAGRRSNAEALIGQIRIQPEKNPNLWRSLLVLGQETDKKQRGAWAIQEGRGVQSGIQLADEFGVDRIHLLIHSKGTLRIVKLQRRGSIETRFTKVLNLAALPDNNVIPYQLWTVPFQDAALLLLRNRVTGSFSQCILAALSKFKRPRCGIFSTTTFNTSASPSGGTESHRVLSAYFALSVLLLRNVNRPGTVDLFELSILFLLFLKKKKNKKGRNN